MEFLSHHGIAFTDKNVRADREALEELLAIGSRATPTTVIDGEVIIGFDVERISELLGISEE